MEDGQGFGVFEDHDLSIGFVGTSHAAVHLKRAAKEKGLAVKRWQYADVVFISEDTPTDAEGRRDLGTIQALIEDVLQDRTGSDVVITSAVPPGFTRALGVQYIIHQAETLRIIDAEERARNPEMLIVGTEDTSQILPVAYMSYLKAFQCPILRLTWEEAELAKVAINVTLAAQVENTNRLAKAAEKVGAEWARVASALKHDKRIGPHSYLEPGRWQDSTHLMRDERTIREILNEPLPGLSRADGRGS